MLGQQKKHPVPSWSVMLMACLLLMVAVSLFVGMTGSAWNLSLFDRGAQPLTSTESRAQPSVDLLRAAKPAYSGGFVPESTLGEDLVSVDVLRAAKPAYSGGSVPESTLGKELVPVDVLRAAKPAYHGGFVPESTLGEEPVPVEVLRAAKPAYHGGFVPESTLGD